MADPRYFRACRCVTAGFGGVGFLTGVVVTLGLLLPLYHDTGDYNDKDSYKKSITMKDNITTKKVFRITTVLDITPKFSENKNAPTRTTVHTKSTKITNPPTTPIQSKPAEEVNVTCRTTKKGREYRGTINMTSKGACIQWKNIIEEYGQYWLKAGNFSDGSYAAAKNYCRNPMGNPTQPWCYVKNLGADSPFKFAYCQIRMCSMET